MSDGEFQQRVGSFLKKGQMEKLNMKNTSEMNNSLGNLVSKQNTREKS